MIGRLLATAAFAVALTGTAMAQMAPPPPANPGPSGAPAQLNSGDHMGSGQMGSGGQMGGSQTNMKANPSGSSGASSTGHQANRKAGAGMSSSRQTAQGQHQQDNIADKLNECESKPMSERQTCIDAATRM